MNTSKSESGVCSSCQKPRNTLRVRKSSLLPNAPLMLCNTCFEGRFEPRSAIILVGRQFGMERVADYIKRRRYVGPDITAREMMK